MKLLLILCLAHVAAFSHASEIEEAKTSVLALIQPLLSGSSETRPKGTEKFRVDQCERYRIDWMAVLLKRADATLTYRFSTGCDIEGVIRPEILTPFPAKLKLRNLQNYTNVESINKISAMLEAQPILNLEVRNGLLSGSKSKVKFEADYRIRINATSGKTEPENLGGELRITEINGKKMAIKEKIMVK